MNKKKTIPAATVNRLPMYLRYLKELAQKGDTVISSYDLAELAGGNGPQLRKDLSYLGELGTRGVGYDVESLIHQISEFMGLNKEQSVAIIGAGKLGTALFGYEGFAEKGFKICAIFDTDLQKVDQKINGLFISDIKDLERIVGEKKIEICIITTPASEAQKVADKAVSSGINAILNFAPVSLKMPDRVVVRQIDLSIELQILSFYKAL
ncbi:redox-sensing transcriptional repressor Rex [Candidatus Oleimmundimicrobium sp.]|uniref:redox-sensing transcriptional repressor Rex n=1 Tax=Candidatus Oleimmundimicrobium sp. TaxID=3060597 RepID=UPI0027221035|nr:redox-sensing transcriptional repressor Rex [Candidatus Oleimmundimicrobium sp.]MDO8885930.1 redox-sensing transcriptional repressor Rex [Candidatus Oleimmundimicrobium sp.]